MTDKCSASSAYGADGFKKKTSA